MGLDLPMVGSPISGRSNYLETTMYEFEIHDMTCSHCASTVEKAIKTADPGSLRQHRSWDQDCQG